MDLPYLVHDFIVFMVYYVFHYSNAFMVFYIDHFLKS